MTVDDVKKLWRADARTQHQWRKAPSQAGAGKGECKGEWMAAKNFGRRGYMKPGNVGLAEWQARITIHDPNSPVVKWPLPYYEKIASDLAYELSLPVPAALIWEKEPPEQKAGYPNHAVMSLEEFPDHYSWSILQAMFAQNAPPIAQMLGAAVAAGGSSMIVFDTWLGQNDRGAHPDNVLYGYDPAEKARARLVFLDFGRSMNWRGAWEAGGWKNIQVCVQPPLIMQSLDRQLVRRALDGVQAMAEDAIRGICTRLTGSYFTAAQADVLADGLVGRRGLLRGALKAANAL